MRIPNRTGSAIFVVNRLGSLLMLAMLTLASGLLTPDRAAAQEDLSGLYEQAAENFRPVTEEELEDARADLRARMRDVEQFVRPTTSNGQRWLRYLRWEQLNEALRAEGPTDLRPLATTYQQLNRDETGLESRPLRRLADALQRYIDLAQIAQQPDQQQYYRRQLEALETQVEQYRDQEDPATAAQIGARLSFIASLGGAEELLRALRRELVQPNAFMEVSTAFIAAGVDPVNRREPVTDCILGTSICSDAHTRGRVGVASIPSEDSAILEFVFDGRTYSQSVGHNDPVVIRSTSNTDFRATKRLVFTDRAFLARPARSDARTNTHLQSVAKQGGGLGSRIISNIGWKRARQNEQQAEAIAADHAEDRIDRRFDEEINDEVREARRRYEEEYRQPLERQGQLPQDIRFSSTSDSLRFEVAQAGRAQLGARGAPPKAPAGHDMTMRLHESAVNNYSASFLSGATATQGEPGQDLQFDVKLPQWIKDAWEERDTEPEEDTAADEPFKPYSLRFRETRPVTVSFANNEVNVTVHIARLTSGERTFTNWDVTGVYKPEYADGGIVLRRDEDLVMLPSDFRGQLSPRQVAERRNLEEELKARSAQGRGFPTELELEPLQMEGNLADVGPLVFNRFESGNGWLVVAWDRRRK